jgi:hypothetical protein
MRVSVQRALLVCLVLLTASLGAQVAPGRDNGRGVPRTADGKPDLQGIWQVRNRAAVDLLDHSSRLGMPGGEAVMEGGEIPYQPWAAARKVENLANRQTADPFGRCYMPGVPRIMYLDFAFQIFQTPTQIAETFEWGHLHRLINMSGKPLAGVDFWMGDSRGRWEGDTLVVDVTNNNDKTWFDMAGDFHSGALHVVERYTMTDADTIRYEATIEDAKVFTRPWKISMPIYRQKDLQRLPAYDCAATN